MFSLLMVYVNTMAQSPTGNRCALRDRLPGYGRWRCSGIVREAGFRLSGGHNATRGSGSVGEDTPGTQG